MSDPTRRAKLGLGFGANARATQRRPAVSGKWHPATEALG
jgi:hypothetical protein